MNIALTSCLVGVISCVIALGTLIYKFSQVVAMVNKHDDQIKDLKEVQKEQQRLIEQSLADIRNLLNSMDKSIGLISQRLDYVEEREKNDKKPAN